jgi:prevent-host-death family protein
MQSMRRSRKSKSAIEPGSENPSGQVVIRSARRRGTDQHGAQGLAVESTPPSLSAASWTVADAKARLSEVLEKARTEGPQVITRNGKETAVIVGIEEWERKTKRKGTLADFLLASPLRGSDVEIERSTDAPREVDV